MYTNTEHNQLCISYIHTTYAASWSFLSSMNQCDCCIARLFLLTHWQPYLTSLGVSLVASWINFGKKVALCRLDTRDPFFWHGPLARYVKLRVRMRRECRERFPRHRRWAIPTCITARASRTCRDACRDRQLSVSFEIGGGGKRSRHSRRMRNLQFYVSGKRPMV